MTQFQYYWILFGKDLLTLLACFLALIWLFTDGMSRIDSFTKRFAHWLIKKLTRNRKPEDEEPE